VRKNLQDVDEEIAELGDGSVILCTDDYTIYDDIDEYDGIDAHLAITHDDAYVIGDAHVNSCENRHSFIRQWLAKFRGVSKHYLQGYLDFLSLLQNETRDWFDAILSYDSSA
jgi:transposase-like protein